MSAYIFSNFSVYFRILEISSDLSQLSCEVLVFKVMVLCKIESTLRVLVILTTLTAFGVLDAKFKLEIQLEILHPVAVQLG